MLLHRLREALRALAQRVERAALRIDGAVGVALAEIALGLAHGVAGSAELIQPVLALTCCALLALLILAEAAVFQFVEQLVEAVAQRLLVLPQFVHESPLIALLPGWPCLPCWPRWPFWRR